MCLLYLQYTELNFRESTPIVSHRYSDLDIWIRVIHQRMRFKDIDELLQADWHDGPRFVQK